MTAVSILLAGAYATLPIIPVNTFQANQVQISYERNARMLYQIIPRILTGECDTVSGDRSACVISRLKV